MLVLCTLLVARSPTRAPPCGPDAESIGHFMRAAFSGEPITDKVTNHTYDQMYGMFLMPLRGSSAPMKMLEIGLGCDMWYGPGASVRLWRTLFPRAEIWEAELDAQCVKHHAATLRSMRVNALIGSQGDPETLRLWSELVGTDIDIVIDDGSHRSEHVLSTFDTFWPLLRPGGHYFIEDIHVSRSVHFAKPYDSWYGSATRLVAGLLGFLTSERIVADAIHAWIEQLLVGERDDHTWHSAAHARARANANMYPMPDDIAFIFCQREACVLTKTSDAPAVRGVDPHEVRAILDLSRF